MCIYKGHRYLHAKFQKHLPQKKPKSFHLKIWSILSVPDCTVCVKNNALQLWLKKVEFFFRSIFFKFSMQVPMTSNIIYIKLKNPPRKAFGRQPPRAAAGQRGSRALCYIVAHYRRAEGKLSSCFLVYYSIVRAVASTTRVAKMTISQGCHPRRAFWLYIYNVRCHRYLHANFQKNWPQKKKPSFFIQSCSALLLLHTVQKMQSTILHSISKHK